MWQRLTADEAQAIQTEIVRQLLVVFFVTLILCTRQCLFGGHGTSLRFAAERDDNEEHKTYGAFRKALHDQRLEMALRLYLELYAARGSKQDEASVSVQLLRSARDRDRAQDAARVVELACCERQVWIILPELESGSIALTKEMMLPLLKACVAAQDYTRARRVVRLGAEHGVKPEARAYSSVVCSILTGEKSKDNDKGGSHGGSGRGIEKIRCMGVCSILTGEHREDKDKGGSHGGSGCGIEKFRCVSVSTCSERGRRDERHSERSGPARQAKEEQAVDVEGYVEVAASGFEEAPQAVNRCAGISDAAVVSEFHAPRLVATDGSFATRVMRWDTALGMWMPDVILVPVEKPDDFIYLPPEPFKPHDGLGFLTQDGCRYHIGLKPYGNGNGTAPTPGAKAGAYGATRNRIAAEHHRAPGVLLAPAPKPAAQPAPHLSAKWRARPAAPAAAPSASAAEGRGCACRWLEEAARRQHKESKAVEEDQLRERQKVVAEHVMSVMRSSLARQGQAKTG